MEKLKASDLRIGNLVYDSTGNTTIVESIVPEHERVRFGIPLNEEWLIKFGFEKLPELNYNRGILSISLWPIDRSLTQTTKAHGIIKVGDCLLMEHTIKYVHQLQNLYHALTGTELTVKQ